MQTLETTDEGLVYGANDFVLYNGEPTDSDFAELLADDGYELVRVIDYTQPLWDGEAYVTDMLAVVKDAA